MALPVLTPEQRQESLARAASARKARSGALGKVRSGDVTLAAVIADPDSPLQRARVRQLVLAVPGFGPVKAGALFEELRIDPSRRLRGLGSRQREALAAHFAA
jgi:hypothetical protein